jgi:TolA-binding protein
MKAISPSQQKRLLLHQPGGRKLNKNFYYKETKAFLLVCLFLFVATTSIAQDFNFSDVARTAYADVLELKLTSARDTLAKPKSPAEEYVLGLAEALELLLTEDGARYSQFKSRFEKRLDRTDASVEGQFLKAELHLQWCFVYMKFGHEFDAALQLRKSYLITKELRRKHPDFRPSLKTSGLLNVMIGSVPEKYNWVLDMLDMRGDVTRGLDELVSLKNSDHKLAFEATLWHAFILGFVLQRPDEAINELDKIRANRNNVTASFLTANLYIKNSNSEKALLLINSIEDSLRETPLPYLSYLKGEVLLHKGNYDLARAAYDDFLRIYKGKNYVRDAWYKKGICSWLMGNEAEARRNHAVARSIGEENTEADKYASRALMDESLPPVDLIRLRYLTDGGYYEEAQRLLNSIDGEEYRSGKNKVELHYRSARLYHKSNNLEKAIIFYRRTIEASGNSEWYFAPNACLQLGYIAIEQNRSSAAREYFKRALTYKRHEYKNSIDSKARSALDQLKDSR